MIPIGGETEISEVTVDKTVTLPTRNEMVIFERVKKKILG